MRNRSGAPRSRAPRWWPRGGDEPRAGGCAGTGDPSCAVRCYAALEQRVAGLLTRLRQEPDLAGRTEHLAALAHAEGRLARLHPRVFPAGPATLEQATAMAASARLLGAVTIASRGALGERVAVPRWTRHPWSLTDPALRILATSTDPARRARALELLAARMSPHLGRTATECLTELAAIENGHAGPDVHGASL